VSNRRFLVRPMWVVPSTNEDREFPMAKEAENQAPVLLRPTRVTAGVTKLVFTRGVIGLAVVIAAGLISIDTLTDARPRPIPVAAFSDASVFEIPTPTTEAVDLGAAHRDVAAALAPFQAECSRNGRKNGPNPEVGACPNARTSFRL
jgi:hypothetical protein